MIILCDVQIHLLTFVNNGGFDAKVSFILITNMT